MKTVIFTILSCIFFAVAAEAQTKTASSGLSLDNAITVNFGRGVAISGKAAASYTHAIKAKAEKGINSANETSVATRPATQIGDKNIATK